MIHLPVAHDARTVKSEAAEAALHQTTQPHPGHHTQHFPFDSARLYRKLDAAGAQPVLDLYEGLRHAFQADLVPEAGTAVEKAAAFIATRVSAANR
jgi:acetyl esterase/lipase